jgi:hypothetical protein
MTEAFTEAVDRTQDHLMDAIGCVEEAFGPGYTKIDPEVVVAFVQTASRDASATRLAVAVEGIAMWLKYLGTGDAATTMGAIEHLGVCVKEAGDRIAESIVTITPDGGDDG